MPGCWHGAASGEPHGAVVTGGGGPPRPVVRMHKKTCRPPLHTMTETAGPHTHVCSPNGRWPGRKCASQAPAGGLRCAGGKWVGSVMQRRACKQRSRNAPPSRGSQHAGHAQDAWRAPPGLAPPWAHWRPMCTAAAFLTTDPVASGCHARGRARKAPPSAGGGTCAATPQLFPIPPGVGVDESHRAMHCNTDEQL